MEAKIKIRQLLAQLSKEDLIALAYEALGIAEGPKSDMHNIKLSVLEEVDQIRRTDNDLMDWQEFEKELI